MSDNRSLLNVHNKVDRDEWYTKYEDVKAELDNYDLTGLKIVCPCDGEQSAFVKYMRDMNYDFDYFEGDYESVNYDKYDVVITNPPFKNYRKFYELIKDKKFIVVTPIHVFEKSWFDFNNTSVGYSGHVKEFYRPDGSIEKLGNVTWMTNMKTEQGKELPLYDSLDMCRTLDDGSLEVPKKKYIPNIKGKYNVPITIFEHTPLPSNIKLLELNKKCYYNGKQLFSRYLIEVM